MIWQWQGLSYGIASLTLRASPPPPLVDQPCCSPSGTSVNPSTCAGHRHVTYITLHYIVTLHHVVAVTLLHRVTLRHVTSSLVWVPVSRYLRAGLPVAALSGSLVTAFPNFISSTNRRGSGRSGTTGTTMPPLPRCFSLCSPGTPPRYFLQYTLAS